MRNQNSFTLWYACAWEPVVSLSWFDSTSDEPWPRLWHSYIVYPSTHRGLFYKDKPPTTSKTKSEI